MLPLLALACTKDEPIVPSPTTSSPTPTTSTTPTAPSICATEGFGREVAWDAAGPYGLHRHDLAEDFTVPLDDGTSWTLSAQWTGCASTVFLVDPEPADLAGLVEASPDNVTWLLVASERSGIDALSTARDEVVAGLGPNRAAWWDPRFLVVGDPIGALVAWVGDVLSSPVGQGGFAVDRAQRIRGLGSFSDVERYVGGSWPWADNVAYAAYEVAFWNEEAERQAALDAEVDPVVVPVFRGEVLSQLAEADVTLPDLAAFDTFEIEIEMRCPDPELGELGNCGAWDYLAALSVQADDGAWIELARFITTYHREAHWVADASPMLPLLGGGGTRRIKWEWAPYWNVQPTSTFLTLRFVDRGTGERPVTITPVATGGPFGSTYNDGRLPVDVPIPADATRAELVAIVTGHGAGTNNCAEFCNHEHTFTVGSASYPIGFPEAGTESGCADVGIAEQMTPNQGGTWWFGRGGWCPGQPVLPHIFDVTGEITPGSPIAVTYEGAFRGATPPDGSGDILLNAWLVTYAAAAP